jgi:hypothetical protein
MHRNTEVLERVAILWKFSGTFIEFLETLVVNSIAFVNLFS